MRKFLALVALGLAAYSGAAYGAPAAAFDLICTGQSADYQGVGTPWTDRLSIDLTAKRWCDRTAGCPFVFPVLGQHAEALQLLAVKTTYNEASLSVDLKTGAIVRSTRIPDRPTSPITAKGVCKRMDFTPLG